MSSRAAALGSLSARPLARVFARLSLREREVRDSLWLIGSLVWATLPLIPTLPLWTSVTFFVLIAWRLRVTWTGRRLPPRWLLIGLLLLGGVAVQLQFHTIVGKDAGVAYIVLLLGLKLLELRARRDIFVVVYLVLFIMLTSLFDAQSMLAAVWLVSDMVLLTCAMLRIHFGAYEPPLRAKLAMALRITLLALPLMVILFVLFPRVSGPLWGLPADAYAGLTGLTDSMAPGSLTQLAQSDSVAFEVKFQGRTPPLAQRYWRGPVLTFYDGRVWRSSFVQRGEPPPMQLRGDPQSDVEYTETLEPMNRPWLFLLDVPRSTPTLPGNSVVIRPDLQVVTETPIRERTRFDARSAVDFQYGLNETPAHLQSFLQLPSRVDPRSRAYGQSLAAEGASPARIVTSILDRIATQDYFYTLSPPPDDGPDSIDRFFFDQRRGFCEHYAGAMVFILRAAGVPARVVTGYLGGDINPVNGYLAIKQRDAHAWVEYWSASTGWTRADPTAAIDPSRIDPALKHAGDPIQAPSGEFVVSNIGLIRYLQLHADALKNAWDEFVIGYSGDDQAGLLSRFGIPQLDWSSLTIALGIFFSLALLVIAGQVIIKHERPTPLLRLYARLCRETAKSGLPRRPDEGPEDYAQRVAQRLNHEAASAVRSAFAEYCRLRYGKMDPSQDTSLTEFRRRVQRVARLSMKA